MAFLVQWKTFMRKNAADHVLKTTSDKRSPFYIYFIYVSPISHLPMLVPWVVSYDRLNCTPCGLLEGLQLEIEVVVLALFPRSVAKHNDF